MPNESTAINFNILFDLNYARQSVFETLQNVSFIFGLEGFYRNNNKIIDCLLLNVK